MEPLDLNERNGALRLRVRAKPRAAKSRIAGVRAGLLEVAVAAPPVDGKANAELVRTIARWLGLPPRRVIIVTGEGSRTKLVSLEGITAEQLRARLPG